MTGLRYVEPIRAADVSVHRLRRQWAILPISEPLDLPWCSLPVTDRFTFHYHPDLVTHWFCIESRGVILAGLAVQPNGVGIDCELLVKQMASANEEDFVDLVISLVGIYVVVRYSSVAVEVFTDPAGMINVFYRPCYAASTPTLIPDLERDRVLDNEYRLQGCDDWYTGSLCPFVDVKVLLANHCLNVETGRIKRFWPNRAIARLSRDEAITQAAVLLKRTAGLFVQARPVLASLTGGRDTRVQLAALSEYTDAVEFFTISGPGVNRKDIEYACSLAKLAGLNHHIIPYKESPPWLYDLYDEMTSGLSIGTRRDIIGACNEIAGPKYTHLSGNLGAVAIGFFWDSANPRDVRLDALAKEFINRSPTILGGLEEWLATVPDMEPTSIYNLMYLEQRGGRWMGIGETAACLFYESGTIFCSRQLFEIISGAPLDLQRGGDLLKEFVRELRPDLLKIPYCGGTPLIGRAIPKAIKEGVRRLMRRDG